MHRTIGLRRMLLAGASAIAMLVGAGAGQAEIWDSPGGYTFVAPSTGTYEFGVIGATGGWSTYNGVHGGAGAAISGEITLTAGESVDLIVGGAGQNGDFTGGGGGLSAIKARGSEGPFIVAGGGGGAGTAMAYTGGPGQDTPNGEAGGGPIGIAGGGLYGGAGGVDGTGGLGGGILRGFYLAGGGGGGSGMRSVGGAGTDGAAGYSPGKGGVGFSGGTGAASGGFGGGGGASICGGGGGGGFSGGGAAGCGGPNAGGGGGGSFAYDAVIATPTTFGTADRNGFVLIDQLAANAAPKRSTLARIVPEFSTFEEPGLSAPEPSTWAMALSGFGALGALLIRRKRRAKPA